MLNQVIQDVFPNESRRVQIDNGGYIKFYYQIAERYIFVPYEMNSSDLVLFRLSSDDVFSYERFIDELTKEVATLIQANIGNHDFLKTDIYLLILVDSQQFDFGNEEVLRVENDKFCCRKIIFKYDGSDNKEYTLNVLKSQFKNKFLFNRIVDEYLEQSPVADEKTAIEKIVYDPESQSNLLLIKDFTFKELQDELREIYRKFNVY